MTLAYSVNLSATLTNVATAITPGTLLVRLNGAYAIATTANRTGGLRAEAVALTAGTTISVKEAGTIPPSLSGLAAGTASWVRASATGFCERAATPADPDDVIGWCEVDGTVHLCFGTLTPTIIAATGGGGASAAPPGFRRPEDEGAVGDGVTDDQTAFDTILTAIAAGTYKGIWGDPTKSYFVSSGVTIATAKTIVQDVALVATGATVKGFHVTANYCRFIRCSVSFNYNTTGQVGFLLGTPGSSGSGPQWAYLRDCYVYKAAGYGFEYVDNPLTDSRIGGSAYPGPSFIGCEADTCNVGFYVTERGEYARFTGCQAVQCNYGFWLDAGNYVLSGCNASGNQYNLYITPGTNDAHGSINGCTFNHATARCVYVGAITNGQLITDCEIYGAAADIECAGSTGAVFKDCVIDVRSLITGSATSGCGFEDCVWVGGYANTFSETANYPFVFWGTHRKLDGSLPSAQPDLRTRTHQTTALDTTEVGDPTFPGYRARRTVTTTDATVTSVYTWTIPDESATLFVVSGLAKKSDSSQRAGYSRMVLVSCDGGVVAVNTIQDNFTDESGGFTACNVTIDNSGTTGRVRVTGLAATTIKWGMVVARMELL